jgi:hypothetical protein
MNDSNKTVSEWQKSVAEWVEQSCRVQGVPVKVTDSAVLGQVAVMLGAGRTPVEG